MHSDQPNSEDPSTPPVSEKQKWNEDLELALRALGQACQRDLVIGTRVLHLHSMDDFFYLDSYDASGKLLASLRADLAIGRLRDGLDRLVLANCSNSNGVLCMM